MTPNYTETEVKLYVPDLAAVQTRLENLSATLTAPRVFEQNIRYDTVNKTLSTRGVVLRLRQDSRNRLTFKADGKQQDGIISRTEIEVEISDFAAMQAILSNLGYQPYMVYEKYRTTYEIGDAEIVLDEMPYGNFVEIEGEHAAIEALIQQLGLAEARRFPESYTALFSRIKTALGIKATDLTFSTFKGVTVPETAFVG